MKSVTRSYKAHGAISITATELLDIAVKEAAKGKSTFTAIEFKLPKVLQMVSQFFVETLKFMKHNPNSKPPIFHI